METPLILVGNRKQIHDVSFVKDASGLYPRKDYDDLAIRLGAAHVEIQAANQRLPGWILQVENKCKLDLVEAFAAASKLANTNVIISMSERVGLPLAAVMNVRHIHTPHVLIAHKFSSGRKAQMMRLWPLYRSFTKLAFKSCAQVQYATQRLGIDPARVEFVPANVDHHFFHPLPLPTEDFILAVGNEQRDYATLIQAVHGTGINLVIAGSSPWSSNKSLPCQSSTLSVQNHLPWNDLLSLYARARLVVVPLNNVDYAAGVTGLLEGMAMAKPVIISQTLGISGYIRNGTDAVYVQPGNPELMRQTILDLWESPSECARLGENARQSIEERMNIDIFIEQVASIVQRAVLKSPQPEFNYSSFAKNNGQKLNF